VMVITSLTVTLKLQVAIPQELVAVAVIVKTPVGKGSGKSEFVTGIPFIA